MPAFTVLIPTHDNADTLTCSLGSVLRQTYQDFEVLIVGDGAPARTAEVVGTLAARDRRVHYLPYPKGERHGEVHRHDALKQADSRFVCYLADDDLWFPDHLATMAQLLEGADLAHVMAVSMSPAGAASTGMFDAAADPRALERMRRARGGFGLSSGGHTLEAYRRLPHGWRPAPRGIATDAYFWLQFLEQTWCRYVSYKWPSVLHLSSLTRGGWTAVRRAEELQRWLVKLHQPLSRERLLREALEPLYGQVMGEVFSPPTGELASFTGGVADATGSSNAENTYVPGSPLRFGRYGTAFSFPVSGHHARENWGVWIDGTFRITLPLARTEQPGDTALKLEIVAQHFFAAERLRASMRVRVNGETALDVMEERHAPQIYAIDLSGWIASDTLTIEVESDNPVIPAALGLNDDTRALSVGMLALTLRLR